MKSSLFRNIIFFISLLIFGHHILHAQPYIYYPQSSEAEQDTHSSEVFRLNLQTGLREKVLDYEGKVLKVYWNINQTQLFIQTRNSLDVVDVGSGLRTILLDDIRSIVIVDITDAPLINCIFVSVGTDEDSYDKTFVIDRNSYHLIGNLTELMSFHKPFISDDEMNFFRLIPDSTGIYFDSYSTLTGNKINSFSRCGTALPLAYETGFMDGERGIGIVALEFARKSSFRTLQYAICNPGKGTILATIPFPMRSEAFLTPDAKYVFIEQVNFDKTKATAEYRPGNVFLYESATGNNIQKFAFPAEGKVLVFNDYPNMLDDYLPNEQRSINVDIGKLSLITSFSPSVVYANSVGFTITVKGKNFTSGSSVNWNGSSRTTTFVSDSVLHAIVTTSDIAKVDSPLISVKNMDGSMESNGLQFLVLRQPIVPELLDALHTQLQQALAAGTLGNQQFENELDVHVQNSKNDYLAKDSIGCVQELQVIQKQIKTECLAKSAKTSKRYISAEAYAQMNSSIVAIIPRVLTLPPRTLGTTLDQLSALQFQLRQEVNNKQVGGLLLVPALNLVLDVAKKQAQKKDSIEVAVQVMLFQQTIEDVYLLSKNRPLLGTYVKPGGYISLYYRAGYILQQLPESFGLPLPNMDPGLEQELKQYQTLEH